MLPTAHEGMPVIDGVPVPLVAMLAFWRCRRPGRRTGTVQAPPLRPHAAGTYIKKNRLSDQRSPTARRSSPGAQAPGRRPAGAASTKSLSSRPACKPSGRRHATPPARPRPLRPGSTRLSPRLACIGCCLASSCASSKTTSLSTAPGWLAPLSPATWRLHAIGTRPTSAPTRCTATASTCWLRFERPARCPAAHLLRRGPQPGLPARHQR